MTKCVPTDTVQYLINIDTPSQKRQTDRIIIIDSITSTTTHRHSCDTDKVRQQLLLSVTTTNHRFLKKMESQLCSDLYCSLCDPSRDYHQYSTRTLLWILSFFARALHQIRKVVHSDEYIIGTVGDVVGADGRFDIHPPLIRITSSPGRLT